jgi:hypothetical protein
MSRTIRTASAAALLAVCTAFAPSGSAAASPEDEELPTRTQACIRPILASQPSADVLQGWIDGCRRREQFDTPEFAAACLRPLDLSRHSADVIQGWLDGCRLTARSPLSGR